MANDRSSLSRRDFLSGLLGGTLCLGVSFAGAGCISNQTRVLKHAERTGVLRPNMYIAVLPTGVVSLAINKSEIGQGVTTCYATLVAEELEVEPDAVAFYFADSKPEYRTSTAEGLPFFAVHGTGGSTSTKEAYLPLRRAAAMAREMLKGAAATRWGVPASECVVHDGYVRHEGTGKSFGYGELTRDAAHQPLVDDPPIKQPGAFRFIGKRSQRVDLRDKVTGKTVYGIDVNVPNMVCAYPIFGPTYGAPPTKVADDEARAVPGVLDIIPLPWGVAVVAAKYWQALRAARLVKVEWGEGKTRGLDTDALARKLRAHREGGAPMRDDGDAHGAYAESETQIDVVYEVPHLAHAPLEPQNCCVAILGGRAEVWAPCQVPTVIQEMVADAAGIAAEDVTVHTTYVGGGFGRRLLGDFASQAASIAKHVGRPVKLVWSREADMTQGYYRPLAVNFVRAGLSQSRVSALYCHSLSQPITIDQQENARGGQPMWLPKFVRGMNASAIAGLTASNTAPDLFATEGLSDTPYRIENLRIDYTPITTGIPVAFWRSVAASYTGFVVESAMDELALAAGRDPYEFRCAHLEEGSKGRRVLERVAALAGWGKPPGAGHARGIARHKTFGTEVAQVAEVTLIDGRIRVTRVWCAVDCGVVVNPDIVRAQLEGGIIWGISAALDQEVTIVDGVVQQQNYDDYPTLRMFECPQIEIAIVNSASHPSGIGEPGVPPIAPAIANAVYALSKKRLRKLPLQAAFEKEMRR